MQRKMRWFCAIWLVYRCSNLASGQNLRWKCPTFFFSKKENILNALATGSSECLPEMKATEKRENKNTLKIGSSSFCSSKLIKWKFHSRFASMHFFLVKEKKNTLKCCWNSKWNFRSFLNIFPHILWSNLSSRKSHYEHIVGRFLIIMRCVHHYFGILKTCPLVDWFRVSFFFFFSMMFSMISSMAIATVGDEHEICMIKWWWW